MGGPGRCEGLRVEDRRRGERDEAWHQKAARISIPMPFKLEQQTQRLTQSSQ